MLKSDQFSFMPYRLTQRKQMLMLEESAIRLASDIRAAAMLTILTLLLLLLPNTKGISTTDSPWILSSSTLPPSRTMPSLGNGQLAFVPFSDTITVNCLYNGDSWNSHRARVPNYANYVLGGEDPISSEYK